MNFPTSNPRRTACFLLAAPILLVCSPFLFSSRTLLAHDFGEYFGPHAELARKEFATSGELPRWNPSQYAGVPYVGTGQNNLYYPPALLFLVLPSGSAFDLLVALHLLIAAAGVYRLSRSYHRSRDASVLAGLAFGLSFTLVAHASAGHLPNFIAMCLAPLLLDLLRRALRRPSVGRGMALAFGGALMIVAASPQILYQTALVGAALAVVDLRRGTRSPRSAIGVLAGGFAGALALAAVHLLPLFSTALASNRSEGAAGLIAPNHDFDLSHLLLLVVPRYFWHAASEPWLVHEKAMYAGLLPLLLAGVALRSRGPGVRFYAILGLLAFLEALSGLLLGRLPWYGGFRMPERDLWVLVLSVSMLAGVGWQRLREETPRMRPRALIGALVLILAAIPVAMNTRAGVFLYGAAVLASIAAMMNASRWPLIAAGVVALDLGSAAVLELKTGDGGSPPPWYAKAIGPDPGAWRVLDLNGYKAAPVAHGVRLLRGYGHPVSPPLEAFYAGAWSDSVPTLDTLPNAGGALRDASVLRDLNVRWIVGTHPPRHPDWKPVAADGGNVLFEDSQARPMAFLAEGAGSVRFHRDGAHRLSLEVEVDRPREVVVSESWAPGWRAWIDGRPAPVERYRAVLMRIPVPAGSSHIVLSYDPAEWRAGRWVSGSALAAGFAWALVAGFRRLRRRA